MKRILAGKFLKLAICLSLFLGIASAAHGLAEEYYTYHDPDGKLVISNKKPPPGSKIIKKQDLPDLADNESTTAQNSKAPSAGASEKGTDKTK
jgi:hypothetical protein